MAIYIFLIEKLICAVQQQGNQTANQTANKNGHLLLIEAIADDVKFVLITTSYTDRVTQNTTKH